MERLARVALALLVWVTAAMTVIAGTPRLRCLCRYLDGRPKLCCSSFPIRNSDFGFRAIGRPERCCVGECPRYGRCNASRAGAGEKFSTNSGKVISIGSESCRTGIVLLDLAIQQPQDTSLTSGGFGLAGQAIHEPGLSRISDVHRARLIWKVFRVPPPTDLVSAQQRLTI